MDQSNISNIWTKFIIETIVLVLTGLIATFTVILRKKIIDSLISFLEFIKRWRDGKNPPPDGGVTIIELEVRRDIRIHDLIADLRNKTNSDRSYVFQFHNGNIFSSRNHVWRLTRTHESINNGIRACAGELKGIISSSVHELLIPLWDSDISNRPGISKVSPENCTCTSKDKCAFPHGVYLYKINEMNEGYTKGLLMAQAVQYMVTAPLLDQDNNRVGFIGLDFCWRDANLEDVKKCAELICKTASIISYELAKRFS